VWLDQPATVKPNIAGLKWQKILILSFAEFELPLLR